MSDLDERWFRGDPQDIVDALVVLDDSRPDWHAHARCRGVGAAIFYATPGTAEEAEALSLCSSCPVFDQCGEASQTERAGVWAGAARPGGGAGTVDP